MLRNEINFYASVASLRPLPMRQYIRCVQEKSLYWSREHEEKRTICFFKVAISLCSNFMQVFSVLFVLPSIQYFYGNTKDASILESNLHSLYDTAVQTFLSRNYGICQSLTYTNYNVLNNIVQLSANRSPRQVTSP